MPRHLITAALPYANGPVHIGHLAGCYIPADIYTRYLRLKGDDVLFICGSDEHGVPITIKAKQLGITPQQVVDKYHKMMKDSFAEFGISFDHYSRTSAKIHHETASDFFKNLYDKNVFTEEVTQQFYDEEAKQFLADRYITGTCPNCGNENAYGDQCENCGRTLNATDLINPKSKLSGNAPVLKPTKNWFLPLDKFQKQISDWIGTHKEDWKVNVYGQCMSWINDGLKPRAMTRDLDWGVKVPLPDTDGKVLYVWFDAPIGYISATKEFTPDWKKYWQDKDSNLVHFIGKDNIVFHCIIFPAMLMAHGDYVLPVNVPANEFLNLEGDKISTSRNWAVWLHEYLQDFPGREDELRYVLTSIAPETKDSEFTWKDFQTRVNSELGDILGNYIKRVVDLINMFFDGQVPTWQDLNQEDTKTKTDDNMAGMRIRCDNIIDKLDNFNFRDALFDVIQVARKGNQHLQENAPWKLIKEDKAKAGNALINAFERCIEIAALLTPFLPSTSSKIFNQLNVSPDDYNVYKLGDGFLRVMPTFDAGHKINKSEILFAKITDEEIQKQIDKLHATKSSNTTVAAIAPAEQKTAEIKPETTFDDFNKMDIRVATILEAERVPKTDKLLKLLLDTGIDKRTVVSGIAANYEPEKIIGQKVVMLANLAPRKIKGIESKGMILMAENEKGELSFVSPTKIDFNNGSNVK